MTETTVLGFRRPGGPKRLLVVKGPKGDPGDVAATLPAVHVTVSPFGAVTAVETQAALAQIEGHAQAAQAGVVDLGDELADLTTLVGGKANTADVYSRTAADALLTLKADLVSGTVPSGQLPGLALNHAPRVVADRAALLALTGVLEGQSAVVTGTTDQGTYVLDNTGDPTVFGHWVLLKAPTDVVQSVNGHNGTVVLAKTDVGLDQVDNTSDAGKPISSATATALAGKQSISGLDAAVGALVGASTGVSGPALDYRFVGAGVGLKSFGLNDSTTNLKTILDAAVAAGVYHPVIPARATPWPLTSTSTLANLYLDSEPGARVSATMTQTLALDLTNCRLQRFSLTSPYGAPITAATAGNYGATLDAYARSVRLNDNCVVEDLYMENACAGIDIRGKNIRGRNLSFYNLRYYKGWAAAIHGPGQSVDNVDITGVKIDSCDRGCEFESGATNVFVSNGRQKDTFPVPYTGQPVDFATYTFVISAHSHAGEGACVNIRYQNWVLENCGGGPLFVRSSGTDDNDMPRYCSAKQIQIIGNHDMPGSYEMIGIQGHGCGVDDVIMRLGAGITSLMKARFYAGPSDGCYISNVRAEAYSLPVVTVDNQHTGARVEKIRPVAGGVLAGSSGYVFDISGANARMTDCDVISVAGSLGYLNVGTTATRAKIKNNDFSVAVGETFDTVITAGATHVQVHGNTINNQATTPPIDIRMRNTSANFLVTDNNIDRGAGTTIELVGGSANGVVTHNILGNAAAVISDLTSGAGNHTIERNKVPGANGWSDPNSKTAVTDIITVNGTAWNKRPGATSVSIMLIPGGSGGGSGRRGAAGSVRAGGGAGGAPSPTFFVVPASILPSAQSLTIGAGGAGGAAVTTDDTNGNPGVAGGSTAFGNLFARAGGAGTGGTNAAGAGGAVGTGGTFPNGSAGGSASATGGAGNAGGTGSGGAGGGLTTGNAASAGGAGGGAMNGYGGLPAATAGAAGTGSGGAAGAVGSAATTPTDYSVGLGGAGGGSDPTSTGGAGGNGGGYGAPGGGGAASVNGQASGKGGNGSPGVAIITTYF